jgi:hypothetical protein
MKNPLIPTVAHRAYVDNEYFPFIDTSILPDFAKSHSQYRSPFVRWLHALSGEKYSRYFYSIDHNSDFLHVLHKPSPNQLSDPARLNQFSSSNSGVLGSGGYSGMNISPTHSSTTSTDFNSSISPFSPDSKNSAGNIVNMFGSLLSIPHHIFENSKFVQREQVVETLGSLIVKYDACISMILQEQQRVGFEQQEILKRRNLMIKGEYFGEESMTQTPFDRNKTKSSPQQQALLDLWQKDDNRQDERLVEFAAQSLAASQGAGKDTFMKYSENRMSNGVTH